jgi:curved DNA-binding protein CbpA
MGNQSSKDDDQQRQLLYQIQTQLAANQAEMSQLKQQVQKQPTKSVTIHDILKNPRLQQELRNHPERRKQVLERLLQEFSHIMTHDQVSKVRDIILADQSPTQFHHPPQQQQQQQQQLRHPPPSMSSSIVSHSNNNLSTYEKSFEEEQREFEEEQERRKQEFLRRQRERRKEYDAKLGELQSEKATALQVFQLNSKYSMAEVRSSYKKLALKYHPDKPGGDKDKFEIITKYYFLLLEDLKKTESEGRGFTDLKTGASANFDSPVTASEIQNAKDNFNIRKFNEMFERYKMYDPNEEGYNDWLKSEDKTLPTAPVFSKKFNIDIFNSTFDSYKSDTHTSSSLTEFVEPQALVSCHSVGFTEIATFEKTRFDKFQEAKNDLGYSDLKSAYSNGNLIDPNSVKFKQYKNVDELERDRSKISFDMSPEDRRRLALQQEQDERNERIRRERLLQRDSLIGQTYQKAHQQMLGYAKGGEPPKRLEWRS